MSSGLPGRPRGVCSTKMRTVLPRDREEDDEAKRRHHEEGDEQHVAGAEHVDGLRARQVEFFQQLLVIAGRNAIRGVPPSIRDAALGVGARYAGRSAFRHL